MLKPVVLVIESDVWVRRMLREVLEDQGLAVVEARSVCQAAQERQSQAPDVVVLDCGPEGVEEASQLRADYPGQCLEMILLSVDDGLAERARRAGARSYL